ncbi:MAG: glycosyltransferase [Patescibacteria group bacterium]|mgnify:CR=1 FL=1
MTKIFIGMPAYNGERFISQAIESLIGQTYTDWVMLISDDTSKDRTQAICEEYARKDARIKYIKQEKNLGLFANFKFTLDRGDSEYFMWAAQDDMWEKDYLQTCVEYLEKDKGIGVATTCNKTIDSFGRTVLESPWMVNLSGKPSYMQVARYVLEPEGFGKNNLLYVLYRTEAAKAIWQAYPQRRVWGQDYHIGLAAISRFGVMVDPKMLFKKRLGGYSSPQLSLTNRQNQVTEMGFVNPEKNQMFPFGRFKSYFGGHMEALRGTPYRPLTALLLLIRLPRAFIIHVKERSLKSFIKRIFTKKAS